MLNRLFPCLMSLAALPALASGERAFEANLSVLGCTSARSFTTGDTFRMVTRKVPAGFTVGAAYTQPLEGELYTRFHLDATSLQGRAGTGLHDGLLPRQLSGGIDLLWQKDRLSVFGGMMGVRWHQDLKEATDPDFCDVPADTKGGQNRAKGLKFGGRVGLEWSFTPRLRGTLSFTQTEFNKRLNPSWFGLGVSYRFASF